MTSAQGRWWDALTQAIQGTVAPFNPREAPFSRFPVLPSLVMGGTDSKHLARLSDGGCFRFLPMQLNRTAGDIEMVHGLNERISVTGLQTAVQFYVRLSELLAAV